MVAAVEREELSVCLVLPAIMGAPTERLERQILLVVLAGLRHLDTDAVVFLPTVMLLAMLVSDMAVVDPEVAS